MGSGGEKQLFGPDIIEDAEQMVQTVRENLRIAQSRKKSYADGKWRDLTFSIDDDVYLKVSPMRGIRRFNVKVKLAPRYIGPFKVLERKGEVAYCNTRFIKGHKPSNHIRARIKSHVYTTE